MKMAPFCMDNQKKVIKEGTAPNRAHNISCSVRHTRHLGLMRHLYTLERLVCVTTLHTEYIQLATAISNK